MGFGQLLDIIGPALQWVVVELGVPDLHYVQDNLDILGIDLIPTVMKSFPSTRQCH